MKIEFADVPAIGLALSIDGQRFDLVAIEPHQKMDGSTTNLLVWQSECATCGAGFVGRSPTRSLPQTRRCADHRQPGRKVR